jgi:hypothetical protein
MPDPNIVRINGTPYSWTSCSHFFNGLPYKGLTAVDFDETREVELVHAGQQDGTPLGITSGIYKVESVSFTMIRDSADGLMLDLTTLGLGSFGDAEFLYTLQQFEPSLPPRLPRQVIIGGCRIVGISEKNAKGPEASLTEIKVQASYVIRNVGGVPLKLWSVVRGLLP